MRDALVQCEWEKKFSLRGNTLNPENGFAAIYHGIIDDYDNPSVTGNIISDAEREFGFPKLISLGMQRAIKMLRYSSITLE